MIKKVSALMITLYAYGIGLLGYSQPSIPKAKIPADRPSDSRKQIEALYYNELLARVRAILRRAKGERVSEIKVANLTMDLKTHKVFRGGKRIDLTPKEYAFLEYLIRNEGQILTRTMISETIWDYHFDSLTNVIDVHAYHCLGGPDQITATVHKPYR